MDRELGGPRHATKQGERRREVKVEGNSIMAGIMGTGELRGNSCHHQAIKDLAGPLRAVARSADGVIEGVEYRDLSERWILAVQWHAEAMREAGENPAHRNLFRAHVEAAERHALWRAAA